jgi:Domain of unknown function (DU1801)
VTEQEALFEELRALVLTTARDTPGVGDLAESLKWGEPSFAPAKPRIGSSVRLARRDDGTVAMLFICHTHLVDRFRELYPQAFRYEGDRALVFAPGEATAMDELRHCIALALNCHLRKRRRHD